VGSDKGYLDHVRALARDAGVLDRVRFLGFVETDELVALYRGAHALVYLSFFGPENLPPLEAFALGCPVVQSDVPGARDQLGDAALFVAPTDAAAVADAVRRCESEDVRAKLVDAGRTRAAGLTADGYVRGVLDFLDDFEPVRSCWP
jgi:glycosyltransferase involved in cell wall biosynthesis